MINKIDKNKKECQNVDHLKDEIKGVKLSWKQIIKMWTLMYEHILEKHCHQGEWLFMHYNQALSKEGLDKLEVFTEAKVDRSFPDSNIRRTFSEEFVPRKALNIYERLCELANYNEID